ncbi:MAG: NAD(P)H-binding protein [Egibacteraceae bacterium]
MPVLVTGAEAGAGRAVVARLVGAGGEVRAYVDREATPAGVVEGYRHWGAKVARGSLDDEGRLELAMEQVHTVVHTGGGFLDSPVGIVDELAGVVSAALGAGCRRLVWLSAIGAQAPGDDPYLAACAEAEALLAEAPVETVVLRRAVTYGPHDPLTALLAAGLPGVDPRAMHAPLYLDDLAAVADAAGVERGAAGARHVIVSLAGPDVVALPRLLEGLVDPGRTPRVPPPVALPEHLAPLLSRDLLPSATALGRTGTPLAEGLARMRRDVS